jgi:hypothetical protein
VNYATPRSSSSDSRARTHRSTDASDGTLIHLWCRSEAEPVIGYRSRAFIGWVAYHEAIPLIRHDVARWEPIVDQAAARAVPLEKPRRPAATTVLVGEVKAPRRLAAPTRRQVRPTLVVGR